MECLKIYDDFDTLGKKLDVPTLFQLQRSMGTSSRILNGVKNSFRLREIEASEFRSAYHALCDWFYGWNVSDNNDFNQAAEFLVKRVPRDVSLKEESERLECERITKTFQTLFGMHRRTLRKMIHELEDLAAKIFAQEQARQEDESRRQESVEQNVEIANDVMKATDTTTYDDPAVLNVVNKTEAITPNTADDKSIQGTIVEEVEQTMTAQTLTANSPVPVQPIPAGTTLSTRPMSPVRPSSDSIKIVRPETADSKRMTLESPIPSAIPNTPTTAAAGMVTGAPTASEQESKPSVDSDHWLENASTISSVPHLLSFLDQIVDFTILLLSNAILIIALCEALNDFDGYTKFLNSCHEVSIEFVSHTFRLFYEILQRGHPTDNVLLAELRDAHQFRNMCKRLFPEAANQLKGSEFQGVNGQEPQRLLVPRMYQKFQFLSQVLGAIDITLFPTAVLAHKNGVKCFQYSSFFSSNIWLTGGYDGHVRIYDILTQTCLAQYVGHRSIVTDVHFTRNDSHIVSCSFDRTIKVWNAQTAVCERTLVGHKDAITSCDITPDNRYIASGSLDNSVRIWDFQTSACVVTIKKHTKWVKCVRFSPDGHYLASGGLDKRIYMWDMKLVLNSKNITQNRCIDSHHDAVLDMALHKPNLLLSSSRDMTVKISDYMTGRELQSVSLAPSWACSVAFSFDGQLFATGSFDNNVLIFKTKSAEKVRQLRVFNLGVLCVGFPDSNQYVMAGTSDGFLQQIPL